MAVVLETVVKTDVDMLLGMLELVLETVVGSVLETVTVVVVELEVNGVMVKVVVLEMVELAVQIQEGVEEDNGIIQVEQVDQE